MTPRRKALFGAVVVAVPPILWGLAGAVRRGLRGGVWPTVRAVVAVPVVLAALGGVVRGGGR